VQIKKADERRDADDIFKVIDVIPGDTAFAPMLPECNFVKS
jgi:branched-chain amino acid transport system substrate-binding protein